jgi:hypothetical protein
VTSVEADTERASITEGLRDAYVPEDDRSATASFRANGPNVRSDEQRSVPGQSAKLIVGA